MSEQQQLWNQIGGLTLETSVLALTLIHLIAREAKSTPDAEEWLRNFADEVHSSIDNGADPPASIQAKIEQSRARIDRLMNAVRLCLAAE